MSIILLLLSSLIQSITINLPLSHFFFLNLMGCKSLISYCYGFNSLYVLIYIFINMQFNFIKEIFNKNIVLFFASLGIHFLFFNKTIIMFVPFLCFLLFSYLCEQKLCIFSCFYYGVMLIFSYVVEVFMVPKLFIMCLFLLVFLISLFFGAEQTEDSRYFSLENNLVMSGLLFMSQSSEVNFLGWAVAFFLYKRYNLQKAIFNSLVYQLIYGLIIGCFLFFNNHNQYSWITGNYEFIYFFEKLKILSTGVLTIPTGLLSLYVVHQYPHKTIFFSTLVNLLIIVFLV